MTAPTEPPSDLDLILPDTAVIAVGSVKCRVKRIRTRELLMLARILTNGAGRSLQHIDFGGDDASDQILAALIMAVPEAPDEVIDLIKVLLHPADPVSKETMAALQADLDNPDPDVILDVIEVIADQEKDTISLLVGKGTRLLEKLTKASSPPAKKASSPPAKKASSPPAKKASTRTRSTGSSTPGRARST
jgi:hypothetical protein